MGDEEHTFSVDGGSGGAKSVDELSRATELTLRALSSLSGSDDSSDDTTRALRDIVAVVGSLYAAIYYIDVEKRTFTCFQELPDAAHYIGTTGRCEGIREPYIERFVDPEFREIAREASDMEALVEHLRENGSLTYEYHSAERGWVRSQFLTSRRDVDGNVVGIVHLLRDINSERILEEREAQAVFEASHDALTGVFNRKAFDDALQDGLFKGEKTGFVIIDVDNFKSFNDERGHKTGDEVLVAVASELADAFRSEDVIFRIGGDEFGLVLHDCDATCWDALCRKLKNVHAGLVERFGQSLSVTLSAGACFGSSGLQEWMYTVADKGLYNTKQNGRAGCTLVGRAGTVLAQWRDSEVFSGEKTALSGASIGLCRMEFPDDPAVLPRLYCGDILRGIYGISDDATPEECYAVWRSRVDSAYDETLREMRRNLLSYPNIECDYVWFHPEKGPLPMRIVGTGDTVEGMTVLYGLHRDLSESKVFEKEDESKLLASALSDIYLLSFYVDLSSDHLTSFVGKLVHPDFQEEMGGFTNFETLSERLADQTHIDCDFFSRTENGWCRASWFPVKRDAEGKLTHAFFAIASIDSAKQAEMEKERALSRQMNLHFEAAEVVLDSHILGIALFDKLTGGGSLWRPGSHFTASESCSFDKAYRGIEALVPLDGRDAIADALSFEKVVESVGALGKYQVPVELFRDDAYHKYVECHFAEYAHDSSKIIGVLEDVTETRVGEGYSLEDLFDNAPGALVMYEWDGQALHMLHASKRVSRLYDTKSDATVVAGEFPLVHPDDLAGFSGALAESIETSRGVQHVFRARDEELGRYTWAKADIASRKLSGGHALLYVMVSDVSEQIEAQHRLRKTSDSLMRALDSSAQLSYEYDPLEHVAVCYTEQNCFGLPRRIENCPESLMQFNLLHLDDVGRFIEASAKLNSGERHVQCDARIMKDGEYRWYSCQFDKRYDEDLGRDVVVSLMTDITLRMSAAKAFEKRIASLLCANEGALCVGSFNLTEDKIVELRIQDEGFSHLSTATRFTDIVSATIDGLPTEEQRRHYGEGFTIKNLLDLAERGVTQLRMDGLYRLSPTRTEWVEVSFEFVLNPLSGDVEGIGYVKSISESRLMNMLVNRGLSAGFPVAVVLLNEGEEYYIFSSELDGLCEHRVDYWSDVETSVLSLADEGERGRLRSVLKREIVFAALRDGREPVFAFNVTDRGRTRRYSLAFSTLDAQRCLTLVSMRDITDDEMVEALRRDARHDALTGLYNRKAVFEECRMLMDEHPDEQFRMVHVNVRRFRLFNSFFGEAEGDRLLISMAEELRQMACDYEFGAYGRIEGDAFCAFFPKREGVLERHIEQLEHGFKQYSSEFLLEPVVGIYEVVDRAMPIESMFARAATAAKEGGARFSKMTRLYDDAMERELVDELAIVREMRSALAEGQFMVYLQPKFNLKTGEHAGAEVLVRWKNPSHGVVSPAKFIPVFESNGFISSLDRYMWEKVCKLLRTWIDEGRDVKPVSVNVSRVSAYNPATVSMLEALVEKYGIEPSLLQLELTETAYIDEPEEIKRQMSKLQKRGFCILMDDFGSGYSSLNTLRELPVDCLKLDMRFLSETCDDERGRTVLSSIVEMTNRLDVPVVAEGVETQAQADYLKSLGCEYVQGYLFERPITVAEYEERYS